MTRKATIAAVLLALAVPAAALFLRGGPEGAGPAAPPPVELTAEAAGYYCQMIVLDHPGPKAQIHLDNLPAPLWFSQVRDAIAYLRSPERSGTILAVYVNDMARAPSWDAPGRDNWIAAEQAWYVVGARVRGGMGAPETVPFGTEEAARAFAAREGGEVMRLSEIPAAAVLAPVDTDPVDTDPVDTAPAGAGGGGSGMGMDGQADGMQEAGR